MVSTKEVNTMTREEKEVTRSDNIPKLFYWIRKVKINDGGVVSRIFT